MAPMCCSHWLALLAASRTRSHLSYLLINGYGLQMTQVDMLAMITQPLFVCTCCGQAVLHIVCVLRVHDENEALCCAYDEAFSLPFTRWLVAFFDVLPRFHPVSLVGSCACYGHNVEVVFDDACALLSLGNKLFTELFV